MGRKQENLEPFLDLSSFGEIRRWIFSRGRQVEVPAPGELRLEIKQSLEDSRSLHHS